MKLLRTIAAAAAATATLAAAADAAVVNVSTTAETVAVGETFEVNITFDAETPEAFLYDALFDFAFDAGLFGFVGADFVDDATDQNQLQFEEEGIFEATAAGADAIRVEVTAASFDFFETLQELQADQFTVVTLTFEALTTGSGTLSLTDFASFLFATDVFDDGMEAEILNAAISVDVVGDAVPLPGAAIFLLTGLAGIAARRRFA